MGPKRQRSCQGGGRNRDHFRGRSWVEGRPRPEQPCSHEEGVEDGTALAHGSACRIWNSGSLDHPDLHDQEIERCQRENRDSPRDKDRAAPGLVRMGGRDRAARSSPNVAQRVQEGAEQLGQRVREGLGTAQDELGRRYRHVEGTVARNPSSSVLIGFGVGFGLGVILTSLLSRRGDVVGTASPGFGPEHARFDPSARRSHREASAQQLVPRLTLPWRGPSAPSGAPDRARALPDGWTRPAPCEPLSVARRAGRSSSSHLLRGVPS